MAIRSNITCLSSAQQRPWYDFQLPGLIPFWRSRMESLCVVVGHYDFDKMLAILLSKCKAGSKPSKDGTGPPNHKFSNVPSPFLEVHLKASSHTTSQLLQFLVTKYQVDIKESRVGLYEKRVSINVLTGDLNFEAEWDLGYFTGPPALDSIASICSGNWLLYWYARSLLSPSFVSGGLILILNTCGEGDEQSVHSGRPCECSKLDILVY